MIWRWVSLFAVRGAVGVAARLIRLAAALALIAAVAPVSVVAAASAAAAWWAGWPPSRLRRAALWCVPMVAAWLAAAALAAHDWTAAVTLPGHAWLVMWHDLRHGHVLAAATVSAPGAIPLGLIAGGAVWSHRIRAVREGAGGRSPATAVRFDRRQWRHQVRSAQARIAAPGSVPLLRGNGDIVVGAVIRSVGSPARQIAAIGYPRLRSHQVIIGTTGTGKTTLLLRLWAGFMAAALRRQAAGAGAPPLLVVLDCKGGSDARRIADRARRVLRDAGAARTAVWPDEARLSLWQLPPGQLITTLADLIEHGTGGAAYYADVLEAVVTLAVTAPTGPPAGTADFLARLDPTWLTLAWADPGYEDAHALIQAAGRQIGDIALRYRALFRRLGPGLDGPGGFGDADAWYCILEGTAEVSVAEGQARALTDLLASYAASGPGREILLAVDEFSAVSRRLPVHQLYERARSLGLAVQVTAQSWEGLAPDEDQRYRIAAAADGGIWLLRTPHPEPVIALAGDQPLTGTTRKLGGRADWEHEGTSRTEPAPVADPALIRSLDTGQVAYLDRGSATYILIKRLTTAPPAISPPPPDSPSPGQKIPGMTDLTTSPSSAAAPNWSGSLAHRFEVAGPNPSASPAPVPQPAVPARPGTASVPPSSAGASRPEASHLSSWPDDPAAHQAQLRSGGMDDPSGTPAGQLRSPADDPASGNAPGEQISTERPSRTGRWPLAGWTPRARTAARTAAGQLTYPGIGQPPPDSPDAGQAPARPSAPGRADIRPMSTTAGATLPGSAPGIRTADPGTRPADPQDGPAEPGIGSTEPTDGPTLAEFLDGVFRKAGP
jgi:hypothetical protein